MQDHFNTAYNIAEEILKTLAPVTDKHIVTAVNQATMIYPDVDKELLKNTLLANHATQIDDFKILEGRERRMPWLKEFKANQSTDWDFWTRYVMYLKKDKHFPDAVIAHLDALTDEILDHLFNPQMENVQIDKKVLLLARYNRAKRQITPGLFARRPMPGSISLSFSPAYTTISAARRKPALMKDSLVLTRNTCESMKKGFHKRSVWVAIKGSNTL